MLIKGWQVNVNDNRCLMAGVGAGRHGERGERGERSLKRGEEARRRERERERERD